MQVGDTVRLVRGGVIGWESQEWWQRDGLIIGNDYTVRSASVSDVSVEGHEMAHHPDHFALVRRANNEFHRGDRVRRTDGLRDGGFGWRATRFNVVTVDRVEEGHSGTMVWFAETGTWLHPSDIELDVSTEEEEIEEMPEINNATEVRLTELRVGDVVRLPNSSPFNHECRGRVATVSMIDGSGSVYFNVSNGQRQVCYRTTIQFELISRGPAEPETQGNAAFWMVIRDDARQTAKRHASYEAAAEEAKRLSTANPSNKFFILESIVMVEKSGEGFNAEVIEVEGD